MQLLKSYSSSFIRTPNKRSKKNHPDVLLLAQMAFFIGREGYAQTGQMLSRYECFGIVLNYLRDELWPLTADVPPRLRARSIFLGEGLFKDASWRTWVGEKHGAVLAQRFAEAEVRRSERHDQHAKAVRIGAAKHLNNVITEIAKLTSGSPSNVALIQALQQLHQEVI